MFATNIPADPISSPAAWLGSEQQRRDDWVYRLSEEESAELDAAIRAHRAKREALTDVNAAKIGTSQTKKGTS
jgi:hypothetical protein